MTGMIRLQPTQILLTGEEVSKAPCKFRPTIPESPSFSGSLPWDHNITIRRNKGTRSDKKAQNFNIHEDPSLNEATTEEVDSGEISDMSDFSFGPILFRRGLSGGNTPFTEANSSSQAGDEGSDDERSSQSTSWDGRHSVTTLTNNSPTSDTLIDPSLVDGSISSTDEQHNWSWGGCSDGLTEHGFSSVHEGSFVDIEYLADAELSVNEDEESSRQDSDIENHVEESYFLPMDGTNEDSIREKFTDMHLYASPVAPPQDNERFCSRESPASGTPGSPGTPGGVSIPPTPPSVRRLLEEVSPHLDVVAGFSPRHVAVSRSRLAHYRSRSLQQSALTEQVASAQEEDNKYQRFFNSSPPSARFRRRAVIIGERPAIGQFSGTEDSDGGIRILRQASVAEAVVNGGNGEETDVADRGKEDAERKLYG